MRRENKILSIWLSVLMVLTLVGGLTISVSADGGVSLGLSIPGNPHWEINNDGEYTGNAVWDNVLESGTGDQVSYHWRLYGPDGSTGNDIQGNMSIGDTFKHNLSSYFRVDGDYQFKVQAIGDGLNYTDSEFSALSDIFHYTKPSKKLPIPTGLKWVGASNVSGSPEYYRLKDRGIRIRQILCIKGRAFVWHFWWL